MSKVSKSRTQLPVTPAASFTPVLGGLLQEQSKAGPVKELKHQPQPLSNTPLLIQRKLAVGEPDDKYEQEAERIAALVTQKPVVPVNPAPVAARANDKNTDTPPIVQEVLRTPGQPLDALEGGADGQALAVNLLGVGDDAGDRTEAADHPG